MAGLIRRNLHLVPADVDLVVGVPRSGILPAATIALLLNLRYTDLDSFLEQRLCGTGSTKPASRLIDDAMAARHVLVVDDSLNRGYAMHEVRERLQRAGIAAKVTLAAIYVVPDGTAEVDIAFEVLPLPRIFEWNAFHHITLERTCAMFEGVLCRQPSRAERADAARFAHFLDGAAPLMRPTRPLACVLAGMPDAYRPLIADWLARHGIAHQRLELFAGQSPHANADADARAKARIYGAGKEVLLIEGDHAQAAAIAELSGKPVFSFEAQTIINPAAWSGAAAVQKLRGWRSHAQMADSPLLSREAFKRRMRRVLPGGVYQMLHRLILALKGKGAEAVPAPLSGPDPAE
jgi:adenine/guanine phosphoribosyltransferase-like PRPP-binding protein